MKMKIKMLKNAKWSIDYKAVSFVSGNVYDVRSEVANRMIQSGYAESCDNSQKQEQKSFDLKVEKKAIESSTENKAFESSDENKSESEEEKKKPGRPGRKKKA